MKKRPENFTKKLEELSHEVKEEKSKEPEHYENVIVYFQALSNSIARSKR